MADIGWSRRWWTSRGKNECDPLHTKLKVKVIPKSVNARHLEVTAGIATRNKLYREVRGSTRDFLPTRLLRRLGDCSLLSGGCGTRLRYLQHTLHLHADYARSPDPCLHVLPDLLLPDPSPLFSRVRPRHLCRVADDVPISGLSFTAF